MTITLSVRLEDEQLAGVDAVVELLEQQAQGATISRAAGLRAIILKGVAAIRQELGTEHSKKK
jgi:hypothetical protein